MSGHSGGSAFPIQQQENANGYVTAYAEFGMTLRDYFAAKAMQGILTTASAPCFNNLQGLEVPLAETSYQIADAMLKAREL